MTMDRLLTRAHGYRQAIILSIHVILIGFSNQAAFWLRFDGVVPAEQRPLQYTLLPLLVGIRLLVFVCLRLHEGVWRYASLRDAQDIVVAVSVSTLAFYTVVQLIAGITIYPRTVFIIDALLLIGLLGALRVARRVYSAATVRKSDRRILVYGAGDAGEMIVRDMLQNPDYNGSPIGFIDDDYRKVGGRIHGLAVFGTRETLTTILKRTGADEILIAIPSAQPDFLRGVVRQLANLKVRISTLPSLSALVGQQVQVQQIRELRLEDLLARAPIDFDYAPVRQMVYNRCVLITGAGGTIGSELCRQVARLQPKLLLMLDRYENGLYAIQHELLDRFEQLPTECLLADITDEKRINQLFAKYRPQLVFHAAAHKHVPLIEDNPCEAIKNNVRGTRIVADAALKVNVERFVLISTDKAVNPTSVMGAAKRVAELLVKSYDLASATQFMVVRFGNVLGSNGSVVPRFMAQIAAGGPVTVTHPEMRRYFMLIPEAVQLVLHAAAINDRGSIFVLEMGEQVRVADMARNMIRLSGFVPEQEIEIRYTGVRPGEKLFEELLGEGETACTSPVPKIMMVVAGAGDRQQLLSQINILETYSTDGDSQAVIEQLIRLVPSFTPVSKTPLQPV